ncbi:MAG: hypothetical protein IT548_03140 [Alphaproteobacteria bacterium]|nr:hypothetical protein [Alphaproteobacteria bacterium]
MTLPSDATIATVWPTLTHQRDYVANTRHKAGQCAKMHGNAYVRIGVTGSGQKPCYRIFYLTPDGAEKIFGSYWDNHSPLDNERAINTNWSTAAMSFAQLDALMLEKHGPGRTA